MPLEEIGFLLTEKCYKLGLNLVRRAGNEANGIYLPCAQWPHAVESIAVLERDPNLPVVTSFQGMLLYYLRRLGIRERVEGYGRLFDMYTV